MNKGVWQLHKIHIEDILLQLNLTDIVSRILFKLIYAMLHTKRLRGVKVVKELAIRAKNQGLY